MTCEKRIPAMSSTIQSDTVYECDFEVQDQCCWNVDQNCGQFLSGEKRLFIQTYNILSHSDSSSAHKIAPCLSPGCPLRNPLVMVIQKRGILLGYPTSQWLKPPKLYFSSYVPTQVSRPSVATWSHRPRPTEGCTGAFHCLSSEVMSLPPLITSSQNALAKTSNTAMPDFQGPGKYSLLYLQEERELQSSWNFYIKTRVCRTSSTAGSVLNGHICSEPCQ